MSMHGLLSRYSLIHPPTRNRICYCPQKTLAKFSLISPLHLSSFPKAKGAVATLSKLEEQM